MEIFSDIIFNVKKNQNIKLIIEQANSVLVSIITKYGEVVCK